MKIVIIVIIIFISLLSFMEAQASFNERIAVQGFLKASGTALNSTSGFPMQFQIKKNTVLVWCQTSSGNIPVVSGVLSAVLSGNSNCQSLSNALSSAVLTHSSNTDIFTISVIVDLAKDGFGSADDATFAGIEMLPTPFALTAKQATTADTLTSTLGLAAGGTGATTAVAARTNLGLGTLAVLNSNGVGTDVLYGNGSFGPLPTTSLAGDVTGAIESNTVTKMRGRTISPVAPLDGQILTWNNSTTQWEAQTAVSAPVTSVAGRTGDVILTSTDVTDASSTNTASKIVLRDASGNFAAGTITANLTGTVTGNATNVTGTVAVANGGTGATTVSAARTALGAAASGANTDITSINGSAMQASMIMAGTTAGTTTAYTLNPTPALSSLVTGQTVILRINATNTGATTLNVNGLGAKSVFSLLTGAAVVAGDLKANSVVTMTYDGTNWLAEIPPQYFTATALNCGTSATVNNSVTCPNIAAATVNAGDIVHCSPSADPGAAKVTWSVLATAGNISIRMDCNNNTSACTLTSRNWRCAVLK